MGIDWILRSGSFILESDLNSDILLLFIICINFYIFSFNFSLFLAFFVVFLNEFSRFLNITI